MKRPRYALPRIRRDPASLRRVIARKREQRQSTAREQRELEIQVARIIRQEVKTTGAAR